MSAPGISPISARIFRKISDFLDRQVVREMMTSFNFPPGTKSQFFGIFGTRRKVQFSTKTKTLNIRCFRDRKRENFRKSLSRKNLSAEKYIY